MNKYCFKQIFSGLGVAQFGSVLEWGSRGREFESPHSDQKNPVLRQDFFIIQLFFNPKARNLNLRNFASKN